MNEVVERYHHNRDALLKEIRNNHIKLGIKSIEQFDKWLFQIAAFASGAIIIASAFIGKNDANVIGSLLYSSAFISSLVIVLVLWYLKKFGA